MCKTPLFHKGGKLLATKLRLIISYRLIWYFLSCKMVFKLSLSSLVYLKDDKFPRSCLSANLKRSTPTFAQGLSGTSWTINGSAGLATSYFLHVEHPRCVECSFSFNTAHWVIRTTTRFPLKIKPSCTVISSHMLEYGLTSGSRCILSSGPHSTITCCNCYMLLSSFMPDRSSSSLFSVTRIYSASLTSSSSSIYSLLTP